MELYVVVKFSKKIGSIISRNNVVDWQPKPTRSQVLW